MCEQTEIHYLDGEVVWVKLGSCWWPGEVFGFDKLPPGVLSSFRKPPIAVVKFFQEDKFEYVRNINSIYKYNCSRKNEFIKKGLDIYRSKHGPMEKFPEDIVRAESATNGDVEILNRDEFQEIKKESYAGLFGDSSKKTPISAKKGKNTKTHSASSSMNTPQTLRYNKPNSDYKVHILVQGTRSSTPNRMEDLDLTPSTSQVDLIEASDSSSKVGTPRTEQVPVSNTMSDSMVYACHACPFTTTRMNIMVHHNKTHSATFIPYTPSPVRKKTIPKSTKTKPSTFKTPKLRKTHKDKSKIIISSPQTLKRAAEEQILDIDKKKTKTDEEIKSSLLADWEDMEDDESPEELLTVPTNTSEILIPSESASIPTTAESSVPEISGDTPTDESKKFVDNFSSTIDKPNSSSDSKYEFCEDEDWSLEADAGRKIPRVKNPSKKRTDLQSSSLEEDDVAREVAELLDKTTVPELPSVPESLKVEENFPELPIAKSPDKMPDKYPDNLLVANMQSDKNVLDVQQKKTIFKTKTFFRSRHSRSQDAIGKYVAEQLNAAERMDPAESEINGAESVPSPEMRESPPVDHVRVARLAPKIQLKKMKAEAQLREKTSMDFSLEDGILSFAASQEVVDVTDSHISRDNCSRKESQNKDENNSGDSKGIIEDFLNDENNYNQSNISLKKDANLETNSQVKSIDEQYKESESPLAGKIVLETGHTNSDVNLFETKTGTDPHYMNETTASAVDALLSVSRETDRVTKIISNDLPEDLFEDEQKDNLNINSMNGLVDKNVLTNGGNNNIPLEYNIVEEVTENECKEDLETVDVSAPSEPPINKDDITNDSEIDKTEIKNGLQNAIDGTLSESDLQIAEALINLPSTALHSKLNEEVSLSDKNEPKVNNVESVKEFLVDADMIDGFVSPHKKELKDENSKPVCGENVNHVASETVAMTTKQSDKDSTFEPLTEDSKCESKINNIHFESEQEKSDNLNAAKSLVQMSETLDHSTLNTENGISNLNEAPVLSDNSDVALKTDNENHNNTSREETVAPMNTESKTQNSCNDNIPSKLLKILEETCTSKVDRIGKISPQKQTVVQSKEKILNFNVCKSPLKNTLQSPKQKIIIRRTNSNKNMINALNNPSQDKIILSKSTKTSQDGSSVPTYTIQASPDISSDPNTIVIQQKVRKLHNSSKAQKAKPQTSLVNLTSNKVLEKTDDALFDISSMPIVLSEDLNPESLDKMPIVMTDGNVLSSTQNPNKPKQSTITEKEMHAAIKVSNKTDIKTLIMNAVTESSRSTTPNIISKASKLKSGKPMIIIDKLTGKQRIILPKQEIAPKEVKSSTPNSPMSGQPTKSEKFIILPANNPPRSNRPQKIVIDPQSGKAHILIGKSEGALSAPVALSPPAVDNKPVSAKLIPAVADAANPGGTVMIITDAQGTQSRILLTSEHEKLLFPNKQQTITQIKTVPQRQTIMGAATIQKTQTVITTLPQTLPTKSQTRIVPKQRGAIITSKGQLIVGGRITTKTNQSVTSLPEIRPATSKRIISSNPTKVIQTVQKANKVEPLIFLQQKSGTVMQLTAAQFEHLQRTGQIVQRTPIQMQPVMQENKIVVQKTVTVTSSDPVVPIIQKQKGRMIRPTTDTPTPPKKAKPLEMAPVPALTPINTNSTSVVTTSTVGVYPDLDNFEELLPSTAIARQPEQAIASQPTLVSAVAPTPTPTPTLASQITSPATAVSTPHPAPLSDGQLLAVPGEHFGGPQGTFYLCVEDNGTFTAIDNRPLVLENNQLVPMVVEPVLAVPERRDILEAALANSDVFHAEPPRDDGPDFHDLNVNVSVHCRVSETSTTLNQPIMTPVEVPTKVEGEPAVPANLEAGLAVIGVTPQTIPTSLDLPITVTDPRIAPKTTDPLSGGAYVAALLPSPSTDMTYVGAEEAVIGTGLGRNGSSTDIGAAPISMPLLTEEEDTVGKSMPILTDDVGERAVSSVDSTVGSPSSLETRDTELDEGGWSQRLLTPSSDTSDNSAEIPLQPALQLSTADLNRDA